MNLTAAKYVEPFQVIPGRNRRKRVLSAHAKKSGIYLIKENDEIVYVGMSQSCVVEALYRHFYSWHSPHPQYKYRVTYCDQLKVNKYSCTIIETSKKQAPQLEMGIIMALQPRDNAEKFQYYLEELKQSDLPQSEATISAVIQKEDLPF